MPAYFRARIPDFLQTNVETILGKLQREYAADGFSSQYMRQTKAWDAIVPLLQEVFRSVLRLRSESAEWAILLEYPLYRLRRRIDAVVLTKYEILVLEFKVGAKRFSREDERQVEEYALDLRDFHERSQGRTIYPILWSTDVSYKLGKADSHSSDAPVRAVTRIGAQGPQEFFLAFQCANNGPPIDSAAWDHSPYRPVPSVIDAATTIFAGHGVESITNADADNLNLACSRMLQLIEQARTQKKKYLLLLTGVPGSGKTLAGLRVVHDAIATGVESRGDIVYLSGNTPLVTVLREALARDVIRKGQLSGIRINLESTRDKVKTRIQHINGFLKQSLKDSESNPPHEHAIVFDEAQRAWDEKQGREKFERSASEPQLLLELMSRHQDWCVCICLIGSGQEINSGEHGVWGWGEALRTMSRREQSCWTVVGPPSVFANVNGRDTAFLGELPAEISMIAEANLELRVPQRSFRSPNVSKWVDYVLAGDVESAAAEFKKLKQYPIALTRDCAAAKAWLRKNGRGERRYGLLASSGARRLRADGFGVFLNASAGNDIANWYLNGPGDIRSSYALEVPANEYACQGLELDFTCLCWGGDLLWDAKNQKWCTARLSGTKWQRVENENGRRFLLNSYRVLLTRAREGLLLWVPSGSELDATRSSTALDATAKFLAQCGATELES